MNRISTCAAILTLLYCIGGFTAWSDDPQTASQESPEVQSLRVETELMEVYVVVTDREGRIVENLKKEDFELLENDRPQEISFFNVSRVDSDRKLRDDASTGKESARDKSAEAFRLEDRLRAAPARTTLLFVDNLHLSFSNLNWVKQALHRFIKEQMTEQDVVALATSHTLGFSQQFSRDRRLLNYAVEQIKFGSYADYKYFTPNLAAGVYDGDLDATRLAVEIIRQEEKIPCGCSYLLSLVHSKAIQILQRTSYTRRNTLSILENYAAMMANLPGKHMIVLFSDGFTMRESDGGFDNIALRDVVNRAAHSGVTIYSIDAAGVKLPPTFAASGNWSDIDDPQKRLFIDCLERCRALIPPGMERAQCNADCLLQYPQECREIPVPSCYPPHSGLITAYTGEYEQEELNGMHFLAEETGGKMYWGTNNLDESLEQAFDANRFSYVISYHVPESANKNRFRKLEVRLPNHPDYRVRAPSGYSLSDLEHEREGIEEQTPQQRLIAQMRSLLPVTDLGVSVQADYVETEEDNKQVTLTVYFEGDRLDYQEQEQDQRSVVKLEILSIIEDTYGKQVDGISARVEGNLTEAGVERARSKGYRFSRRLPLEPGIYHARIGVREEGSDRIGTASTWVEVPGIVEDKLEMSSLLLEDPLVEDSLFEEESVRVSDLEQVRMVQGIPVYETGDIFYYTFRVHPGAETLSGSDLLVKWEVMQGGNAVATDAWTPVPAERRNMDGKGWFDLDNEVDIEGFDSGVYELQVSIKKAGSNKIVQRTVAFGVE
ncbi:MAG: VWA domain-containing protein [Acidobacteria bacterium]|nr:VWA domain-containing protein [Acidobacteriota bacterium]